MSSRCWSVNTVGRSDRRASASHRRTDDRPSVGRPTSHRHRYITYAHLYGRIPSVASTFADRRPALAPTHPPRYQPLLSSSDLASYLHYHICITHTTRYSSARLDATTLLPLLIPLPYCRTLGRIETYIKHENNKCYDKVCSPQVSHLVLRDNIIYTEHFTTRH